MNTTRNKLKTSSTIIKIRTVWTKYDSKIAEYIAINETHIILFTDLVIVSVTVVNV